MTRSTRAKTSPPNDSVNTYPVALTAANNSTARAGKIQADRGIGLCALIHRLQLLRANSSHLGRAVANRLADSMPAQDRSERQQRQQHEQRDQHRAGAHEIAEEARHLDAVLAS